KPCGAGARARGQHRSAGRDPRRPDHARRLRAGGGARGSVRDPAGARQGEGKVAVIRGILGIATHEERLAGFREAMARAPGIECVAVQPANSERALGMTVMENLLTAHPDLKAVLATNDQRALGAVEATAAHNLTGKVQVVGFDATREAVRAVVAGRLPGDMAGLPEVMGRRAVEEALPAAKGQPVEKQSIITPVLVTKENASMFLQ